ncbi:MAG: ParB/RepB/Spo0J family partition protein [Francisellaceae bacterium]
MTKISLANRKRIHELNKDADNITEKKEALLAMQLKELSDEAKAGGTLVDLPLNCLLADPNQPRKRFVNIEALAKSIAANGVIQPIIVTPQKTDGFHHIIAGERRFRASLKAGLSSIPAIIRNESDIRILILQLLENDQRESISPFEEADALFELINNRRVKKSDVAKSLGRDNSWISVRLKLAKASTAVRSLALDALIEDARTLYEIQKFEEELPEAATLFIHKIKAGKISGSYRLAVTRARESWKKNQSDHAQNTVEIIDIEVDENGCIAFKADKQHGSHCYRFRLSPIARKKLKPYL